MTPTPLRLTKLVIHHFRGLKDLTIDFTAPNGEPTNYHVISGPNKMGKSTVLAAIRLAAGYPRNDSRLHQGVSLHIEGVWKYGINDIYTSAGTGRSQSAEIQQILQDHGVKHLRDCGWWLCADCPNAGDLDKLNLFRSHFDGGLGKFTVGADGDVETDELSGGEAQLLKLAGLFMGPAFKNGSVYLLDEPEVNMHPEWQVRLMPALRAMLPNAQFIVVSKSGILWDQAMTWERTLLVPPGDPRSSKNKVPREIAPTDDEEDSHEES